MSAETSVIREFIRNLLSAAANSTLYSLQHPQVRRLTEVAFFGISAALKTNREIILLIIENELVINGEPQEFSLYVNRFVQILKSRSIGHIKLTSGLDKDEVVNLIGALSRHGDRAGEIVSTEHIRFGYLEVRLDGEGGIYGEEDGRKHSLSDMPAEELAKFAEIYETVKEGQKLKISGISEVVFGFKEAFRQEGESILLMVAMRNTDEYTFTHSTNVCILNMAQAMALGIEGQLLNDIAVAALLHDIGKLFIPEELLTKKDNLTTDEFETMKQHSLKGARYLLDTPGVPRLAITTAFEHHIRYDLTGYPVVPDGLRPNMCSQMTMISDYFDALRTRRPYREPLDIAVIGTLMLEGMGKDFNPVLTRNFLLILARLRDA